MALMFGFFKPKSPIRLFDTRSKALVDFVPSGRTVTMYHCGPTVYDYAHIGNLRAYIFADTLRRSFEFAGYKVKQVVNITDIGHLVGDGDDGDDKMTKALKRLGKPLTLEAMKEVADIYTDAFVLDLDALNIKSPHAIPRASEHIKEDTALIAQLEKKGLAYKAADGMYFDTGKFPAYGALGQVNSSPLHARIEAESSKHDPKDFALWKFDASFGYESPWGKGFPGWHIECSAMARKYLGQPFDIHTGGIDHIPVHHNNEIAQSEGAYGTPLARYWMHSAFITLKGGEKMAKSEGNFLTLEKLRERGIDPLAYRLWVLGAGYRAELSLSDEALENASNTLRSLSNSFLALGSKSGRVDSKSLGVFRTHLLNDFSTPQALSTLWAVLDSQLSNEVKRATVLEMDKALGLGLSSLKKVVIPAEVEHLAEERKTARDTKDWAKADELRKAIEAKGFTVKDTPSGQSLSPLR